MGQVKEVRVLCVHPSKITFGSSLKSSMDGHITCTIARFHRNVEEGDISLKGIVSVVSMVM